ncbi:TfoX-like protein [Primorskyibacter sedentarius]|uniref:TfoX-like protein n=1 Tax=Primorskyibacter sedentarius TaxID=745311 RepID=A0A4R3JD19_9RHOB|nr:TfoX/Sxy family protein [Primorskyibacter sedentarius]TCS63878.1 TfoX-like protein [Primorskyibacter sedentarius]
MSTPISSIRNLGPAVEEACARAGIRSAEDLRKLGAHEAYRRMLLSGTRAHFIGYYVLHMALQGRPWNDCKGKEKEALRTRFDTLKEEVSHSTDKGLSALEAALDAIGVVERPKR